MKTQLKTVFLLVLTVVVNTINGQEAPEVLFAKSFDFINLDYEFLTDSSSVDYYFKIELLGDSIKSVSRIDNLNPRFNFHLDYFSFGDFTLIYGLLMNNSQHQWKDARPLEGGFYLDNLTKELFYVLTNGPFTIDFIESPVNFFQNENVIAVYKLKKDLFPLLKIEFLDQENAFATVFSYKDDGEHQENLVILDLNSLLKLKNDRTIGNIRRVIFDNQNRLIPFACIKPNILDTNVPPWVFYRYRYVKCN